MTEDWVIPTKAKPQQNTQPMYEHDCDNCVWLGSYSPQAWHWEMYYCSESPLTGAPTVKVRFGNDPTQVLQGIDERVKPKQKAYEAAVKRGYFR